LTEQRYSGHRKVTEEHGDQSSWGEVWRKAVQLVGAQDRTCRRRMVCGLCCNGGTWQGISRIWV